MKKFDTLTECIEQLEKCEFQTEDGNHNLEMNVAFIQLKEHAKECDQLRKPKSCGDMSADECDQYSDCDSCPGSK